jgi:cell wall-associated NlpC family hydrolase
MALRESEDAARLLERLLSDRTLRERFRRDPAGVSREAGLERVAEELRARDGKALDTLDGRESRSSLAGVLMAAALEGVGIYDFSHHVAAHADSVPEPVGQVLARHRDHAAGAAGLPAAHAAALPEPLDAARAAPASPPSAAGEFRAITPHEAAAAAADRSAPEVPADAEDAPDDGGGEQGEGEEDSEAGAPRAEDEEEDENEDEEDEVGEAPDADDASSGDQDDAGDNPDGDHDDNSDASDGGGGDDAPDGGDGGDGADAPDGGDGGDAPDGGDGGDAPDAGDDGGDGGDGHAGGAIDIAPGTATYPGDDAPQGQIAAWMAREARSRGLPAELPVMAALVESDMRNLVDGDRDSVGFFQMRHGIWNQGKYAGYPQRPQLQLEWFMDHAVAVKAQRIAAGKPVDDPQSYGEWIADVERPAAEYRGRYQVRLGDARNLLDQASGRSRGPVRDGPAGVEQIADGATAGAGPRAMAALVEARKHMGTPYRWGGSTPQTGFDCSGLVQWAYAKAGIRIPRTSEQQILAGNATAVDRSHLRPGDLVFFRNASGDVHHVGMSLGGDRFINAPHTGARVRINNLKEPYFAREFAGGRRFDTSTPRPDAVDRAPASGPRADGPDIDPDEVRRAETALARDAAEAQQPGTLLFEAVRAQEMRKTNDAGFWPAIDSTSPD